MEKALFWTLVHSLWVGLAAAALAGLVILATKRSSSSARYYGLCGILFGFCGVMVFIFIREWHFSNVPKSIMIVHELTATFVSGTPAATSLYDRIITSMDQTSGWACLLWMLCFAFKTIRLSRELFHIRRLRRERILPTGAEWQVKVWVFRQQLGIQKAVSIFESALVKIPVTLGYLKPVILLPLGLIAHLPPEQVDAILWHELAHIRRRDYLVNIFQSAIEALFFFNPAVLWISTLIREERESCCDDIVLGQVYHKRSYLEALLAFQYPGALGLSLGITGRPHQLIRRLKRMVYSENRALSGVERVLLLAGILLLSAFTMLHPRTAAPKGILITVPQGDTVPPGIRRDSISISYQNKDSIPAHQTNRAHLYKDSIPAHKKPPPLPPLPPPPPNPGDEPANTMGDDHVKVKGDFITDTKNGDHIYIKGDFSMDVKPKVSKDLKGDDHVQVNDDKAEAKSEDHVEAKLRTKANPDGIDGDRQRARQIISRLLAAKVIPDFKSLVWFGLSVDELIVNGVKQPESLHQQLVNDFNIKEGYGLYYGSVQVTGRGVFLNKDDLEQ